MKFLRTLLAGLFSSTAAQAAPTKDPAEMMRQMRLGWLSRVPEKTPAQRPDDVIAVIMDWPLGDQIVTILSSAEGDASLYTTATFGVIGGIGHERVRRAAGAFVQRAQHYLGHMKPTAEFPYPDGKTLCFYVVTPGGVRTVSYPLQEIEKKGSPARELYAAGQEVMTELRLITPEPGAKKG